MKVLQVHFWGNALDVTGSVEKVIDSFARMDSPDIELKIASRSSVPGCVVRHGKEFHTFVESRWRNRLFNKLLGLDAFTFPSLVQLIERLGPDILHFHNRPELVDRLVAKLSRRPKVVCHYHRRFAKFVVPECADLLLTVSQAIQRALHEATSTSKTIRVVYNPVPDFALHTDLAINIKPIRLLYAGGAQAHKGFGELLQAIAPLVDRDDIEIEICGPKLDGVSIPGKSVRVLGMLDHDNFARRMEAAHIVLMPSHFEGFSLLVLEAMACGKLLVSTRGGGLAEIVDTDCALVTEIGNAESLAARITEAIELFSPPERARLDAMLTRAHRKAARFSIERINEDLAQCYRSLHQ